jgi:serine/threonine-protein kinase RsbW
MACITPPEPSQAVLQIASTPIAVRDALRDIMGHPAMTRLSKDARGNADLVLAEALNNIVEHAYDRDDGQIELRLRWLPGRLFCDLLDTGLPMPDCTLPEGLAQSVDDDLTLPEGGFGWFLIRQLTENLLYQRIGTCNHLSFLLNVEQ